MDWSAVAALASLPISAAALAHTLWRDWKTRDAERASQLEVTTGRGRNGRLTVNVWFRAAERHTSYDVTLQVPRAGVFVMANVRDPTARLVQAKLEIARGERVLTRPMERLSEGACESFYLEGAPETGPLPAIVSVRDVGLGRTIIRRKVGLAT